MKCLLTIALVLLTTSTWGGSLMILEGDTIGSDPNFTNGTGGFNATDDMSALNLTSGQPAVLVHLNGFELLNEFRVIVWGKTGPAPFDGFLLFDQFQHNLFLWELNDYLNDEDPEYSTDLGDPFNVTYTELDPDDPVLVVPDTIFGDTGLAGSNRDTYDFRFDLTSLTPFDNPLRRGDWVIAFQSIHNVTANGILMVSGSGSPVGPDAYFSRDNTPRGPIGITWGINVTAEVFVPGDFDIDNDVDASDLAIWEANYGINGITNGEDFLLWQKNFTGPLPLKSIPEPKSLILSTLASLFYFLKGKR